MKQSTRAIPFMLSVVSSCLFFCSGKKWQISLKRSKCMKKQVQFASMFVSLSMGVCGCVYVWMWRVCQAGLSLHKTGPVFTVFYPSGVFWAQWMQAAVKHVETKPTQMKPSITASLSNHKSSSAFTCSPQVLSLHLEKKPAKADKCTSAQL